MTILIENITDEPHQRHTIVFEESEITVVLRFHPTVEMWTIDTGFKNKQSFGHKLSNNVLHMRSRNFPYDFVVTDNSGTGLDPIRIDDFSTGRCNLYMLEADDMETIRNVNVEI